MATAQEYAQWIVDNQDKQGTPEFETVAKAYEVAKSTSPSIGERARAFGAGLQRGGAGLVGLGVDTVENAINLGLAGVGSAATAMGRPELAPNLLRGSFGGSEYLAGKLRQGGVAVDNPNPQDPASRMLFTGGLIGGSMIPGGSPRAAATAATGGALAGEFIGPEWTALGAMAPSVAAQTAAAAKNAFANKAAANLETFKQAGTLPSAGQVTDNTFLHGLENLAAKFPGGSGIMKSFIERQQRQMGAQARTGVSAEDAGRAIERGVIGQGGFLERTKAIWQRLDDDLAAKIPSTAAIKPSNTLQVLDEITRPTPGAEKTSQVMSTPKMMEVRNALQSDMGGRPPERVITLLGADGKTPIAQVPIGGTPGMETIPFTALRELRSKVGSMLDQSLVSGIPGGELRRLYGALSSDMESAANQAGAGREFARQNNYYRSRMARVEDVLDRVIGKGKQPEDIFKAVNPTDPDQANKLRAVMRSLEPSERQVVSEAVANRLGRASPGKQDVYGEVFSSETFLTNWNKLSPGAKAQFFPDPPLRENMEALAKAAAAIRSGKGIYANPSGTAGSFAAYSVYASPIASIATGSVAPLAAAGGAAGSAYIGAKMMTNPKVVEWLAKPINPTNPNEAQAHLARLGVIYNQVDDETKKEIARFVDRQ